MRKYWKLAIIVSLVVLLLGTAVYFFFFLNKVPCLPEEEKDMVEAIYYASWVADPVFPEKTPLIWYDENGEVEEDHVWRYIGTYGDCYAFLRIGDNWSESLDPVEIPYTIRGLAREVRYPIETEVILYHRDKAFPGEDVYGDVYVSVTEYFIRKVRMEELKVINNRQDWLTDEQLERLTQDIEKIAKEYN